MNATGFIKYAAAIALAASSACSGSTYTPSNVATGGVLAVPAVATATKSKYFDYIDNDYGTYASIFDYPTSDKQIGTIKNVGGQMCTNVLYGYGKKIVWIVAGANQISEYSVPSKLLKSLSVSGDNAPSSCAMDTSGDLAVGILDGPLRGNVVIFKHAAGSGTYVKTPLLQELFDGYDNKGNLFFDGPGGGTDFQLDEIPKGSTKVQTIVTSNTVSFAGSVQWDGTYVTVEDQRASKIYRYTISGTKATLKGTVTLKGASNCTQTWIAGDVVFCADSGNDDGEVFKYPAGGAPKAVLSGNFDIPLGTVAAEN
jgi:hypothetical protein